MARYFIVAGGLLPWSIVIAATITGKSQYWMLIVQAILSTIGLIAAMKLDCQLVAYTRERRDRGLQA